MPGAENNDAKQRFLDFLARKKLRNTAPRRAIIDTVFNTHQHFTAEQLLAWSRRRDKSVSRATVYRTLSVLVESGLLHEMDFGKDYKYYDPNYTQSPRHNHIICLDCQRLVEFESDKLQELEAELKQRMGFSVVSHRLQVTAHCDEFRRTGNCKRQGREKP